MQFVWTAMCITDTLNFLNTLPEFMSGTYIYIYINLLHRSTLYKFSNFYIPGSRVLQSVLPGAKYQTAGAQRAGGAEGALRKAGTVKMNNVRTYN